MCAAIAHKEYLQIPQKLVPVFQGKARYRCAHGGRGSAKTRTFALMTAVFAMQCAEAGRRGIILCGREFMNSLEDSSMEEIKQAIISEPWLEQYFDIGEKYIRTKNKRVSFVFAGLRRSLSSIKSKARILLAWVDEAEDVSEEAWRKLIPTVREAGSEVWVTWNPERDGSATDNRFRKSPPPRCIVVEMNYVDNPWFPPELEEARLYDQSVMDDQTYAWIWEGAYRENSEAQVLSGKYRIAEFDDTDLGNPMFGIDWGFSQDPTAGNRLLVAEQRLYVSHEAHKLQLELDHVAEFMIRRLPGIEKAVVRADCARPESIRHVKSAGVPAVRKCLPRLMAAKKWSGSVEDGIAHLRSYREIVIHPRCIQTIKEARMWSYKVDKNTGDVTTDLIDKHNHHWDASRYALDPLIRRRTSGGILLPKR